MIYDITISGEGTEGEIELDYDLDYQVDDQDITSHNSDIEQEGVQERTENQMEDNDTEKK